METKLSIKTVKAIFKSQCIGGQKVKNYHPSHDFNTNR